MLQTERTLQQSFQAMTAEQIQNEIDELNISQGLDCQNA